MSTFSYDAAFDRNIGWVTAGEQQVLRSRRVAIAGLGGVGGAHLLALVRLGVGRFSLAEFDTFDVVNFNRQVGATWDSVGRPKLDVMVEMARGINPESLLSTFPAGVSAATVDQFLDGADLFVDGLDFFAVAVRRLVFARCAALGIPAITAAPIGMGAGYLVFVPGGMSFETYFRLEGVSESEQFLRFLMGMVPRGVHRAYLVDPSRVDLAARRGPSTAAACQLCAGVVGAVATRLLLHRGGVRAAPWHHQFDAYVGRLVRTRVWAGNAGPMQRLRLAVARRVFLRAPAQPAAAEPPSPIGTVLEVARWAPSGDNVQPWRFEITGPLSATVHFTAGPTTLYEYRGGEPTWLAVGGLVETIVIAAAQVGRSVDWALAGPSHITVQLREVGTAAPDPLFGVVATRSVDRRPYRTRPLTVRERGRLEAALGGAGRIVWHASLAARWRIARLAALATHIRLRIESLHTVHASTIDWSEGDSATGIPFRAVGLDRGTLALMRWALPRWSRVRAVNRVLGTGALSAQMDLLPGVASAGYFSVHPGAPLAGSMDALRMGRALQRVWLTATSLGLVMQPALAVLAFAHHGRTGALPEPALAARAERLAAGVDAALGDPVFLARIGEPTSRRVRPRSVRRHLDDLQAASSASAASGTSVPSTVM